MNVTYTGKQQFLHPKHKDQIDGKFAKLAKLLDVDGKGDKNIRVMLAELKNQHRAEITINYLDHQVVGEHVDPDQFTAVNMAIEKLERQMLKLREKRRDVKKGPREGWDKGASANTINEAEPRDAEALPASNGKPKVFHVEPADGKPLTVDEAMMAIEDDPYLVSRDARTNGKCVLLRRPDGNFDLVEC